MNTNFIIVLFGVGLIFISLSLFIFYVKQAKQLYAGKIIKRESQGKYSVRVVRTHEIQDCYIYTLEYQTQNFTREIQTDIISDKYKTNEAVMFRIENGKAYITNYYYILAFSIILFLMGIVCIVGSIMNFK